MKGGYLKIFLVSNHMLQQEPLAFLRSLDQNIEIIRARGPFRSGHDVYREFMVSGCDDIIVNGPITWFIDLISAFGVMPIGMDMMRVDAKHSIFRGMYRVKEVIMDHEMITPNPSRIARTILWFGSPTYITVGTSELQRLFGNVSIDVKVQGEAATMAQLIKSNMYMDIVAEVSYWGLYRLVQLGIRPLRKIATRVGIESANVTHKSGSKVFYYRFEGFQRLVDLRFITIPVFLGAYKKT